MQTYTQIYDFLATGLGAIHTGILSIITLAVNWYRWLEVQKYFQLPNKAVAIDTVPHI